MTDAEKELRRLAQAATPGPWFAGAWSGQCHINHGGIHPGPPGCKYDYVKTEAYGFVSADAPGMSVVSETKNGTQMAARDKGFIAAANPAAVLALLDRIEALEKEVTQSERKGAEEMRERAAKAVAHYREAWDGLSATSPLKEWRDKWSHAAFVSADAEDSIRALPLPGDVP